MSEQVRVKVNEGVLSIELNRPERKNALTHAMYETLHQALVKARAETAVRVVLITGQQDCFTAGNDMADFLERPVTGQDAPVMRFLRELTLCEKPVVAAVNGPAVGVGATLLLHCDLVYLGEQARLQMPFANLGLCPEAGSSLLLPLRVGQVNAARMLLLGDFVSASEALQWGLANAVLPAEQYQAEALRQAQRLVKQPAAAVRLAKNLMRGVSESALLEHMQREGDAFVARLQSPEAREAMTAFVEKRAPDFSGFQ